MSKNDKIIGFVAILVIVVTFWLCFKVIVGAPIVKQIGEGTAAIQSGIPAEDKTLIGQ